MQYRKFGNTGRDVSILGFGMMRMKRNEAGNYDEQWSIDTLRYAIDNGLNYVDTAYAYGDSERITGLALQDGYREKVTLASKIPLDMMKEEADFERILNEELERLQTDHIDAYLLHAMSRKRWDAYMEQFHIIDHLEKAKADGKIRYIGFSFHDDLSAFQYILDGYDKWDFCQIQLNYLDTNYQAGLEGLRLAHERGLAVVIMEPLRGGRLADVPEDVAALLPKAPVETALDYLWNLPEVTVVLSGMSELEQVEQNLCYASRASAGMLTEEEIANIHTAGDKMRTLLSIPCTGCNYCNVCPQNVAIPEIFAAVNQYQVDGHSAKVRKIFAELGERNAAACIGCGACEKKCPQHIAIPEELAKQHKRFA